MQTKLAFLCTLSHDPDGAPDDLIVVLERQVSAALPTSKTVNVMLRVDGHRFRTALFPIHADTHYFYFDERMRSVIRKEAGSTLAVVVELDHTCDGLEVPLDLQSALEACPRAAHYWATLSAADRWERIDYLIAAAPEQRARRVQHMIGALNPKPTVQKLVIRAEIAAKL